MLLPDEVDVVDAHDLVPVDVDDLLVEQVALEQEVLVGAGQQAGRRAGDQLKISRRESSASEVMGMSDIWSEREALARRTTSASTREASTVGCTANSRTRP